jgi:FtsH-binding integral membrane protein
MSLLFIGVAIYLMFQVNNTANKEMHRMGYLAGLAFIMGFNLGPVLHMLCQYDGGEIVLQALLYTGAAFVSFSLVSLFSKRRSWLFLGGVIMTLFQGMIWYRLFSWLFGYSTFNMPYLMVGLFMASIYIVFDTQIIIERAERGNKDLPRDTMLLFVDLV